MFAAMNNPAKAYANVGIETSIEGASPHKLILMLFDGALLSISLAMAHLREKRIAEKGMAISKAIDIIVNGLKLSLDTQAGGELAERLDALYEYISTRLLFANLKNDVAALEEASRLLRELRDAE